MRSLCNVTKQEDIVPKILFDVSQNYYLQQTIRIENLYFMLGADVFLETELKYCSHIKSIQDIFSTELSPSV